MVYRRLSPSPSSPSRPVRSIASRSQLGERGLQEGPLDLVVLERDRSDVRVDRLVSTPQASEQLPAGGMEVRVVLKGFGERAETGVCDLRSIGHRHGGESVELDDRRRGDTHQRP